MLSRIYHQYEYSLYQVDDLGRRRRPLAGQQRTEVVAAGHSRQAREDISQVRERILTVTLARDDQRVEDRRTLTRLRMADKEPILFFMYRDT